MTPFFCNKAEWIFFCTVYSPSRSLHSEPLRRTKRSPNHCFYSNDVRLTLVGFSTLCLFLFFFAMCTNSTHALCIGCTQRLPRCIMLTPQAGGAIYPDRGEKKKKSYLEYNWNLRASYLNLSIYLRLNGSRVKTHTVAILLNFDLPGQVTAAGNGRGTTGPSAVPKSLLSDCENKRVGGDELPVGVCEFCYRCARRGSNVRVVISRGRWPVGARNRWQIGIKTFVGYGKAGTTSPSLLSR